MQALLNNAFMATKKPTISIQISVTPQAKSVIDRITSHTEIPNKRVMSRIFEWFASLPAPAQKSILWPDEAADDIDAAIIAIEYLKHRREEKTTPPAAETKASSPPPGARRELDAALGEDDPLKASGQPLGSKGHARSHAGKKEG